MKFFSTTLCLFYASGCLAGVFSREAERFEKAVLREEARMRTRKHEGDALRKSTLRLNLARWKSAAKFNAEQFILVDIAGFQVKYYENGKVVLQSRAMVGRSASPTPSFVSSVEKLVLNPVWTVPNEIAVAEIIPLLQDHPTFLKENGISLQEVPGRNKHGPTDINWKTISTHDVPFVFKQEPGPFNPLGKVKFFSPNPFSIYLHGTAEPELFESDRRTVSHGCVRLEKSTELALLLLRASNGKYWSEEALQSLIAKKKEVTLPLEKKVPIYFGYWTAWADEKMDLHLRPDIYGWDDNFTL